MSLHITIDSLKDISIDKIQSIFSKIGDSVAVHLLEDGSISYDLYLDFKVNHFKNGYKKIKSCDALLNQDCSICLDKFLLGQYKRVLHCSHVFHKKCIDKWNKFEFNCPQCRSTDL